MGGMGGLLTRLFVAPHCLMGQIQLIDIFFFWLKECLKSSLWRCHSWDNHALDIWAQPCCFAPCAEGGFELPGWPQIYVFLGLWIAQTLGQALLHIVTVRPKVERAEETERKWMAHGTVALYSESQIHV